MKNRFFELIMEELENNKNYQKSSILKMSLLLYIASVSKVVGEELENLRDDNYLFLEYLNNLGFEYNFQSSYLENIEKLSNKIDMFAETYDFVINYPDTAEFIESLKQSEMDLKLDILRGRYAKIVKNYADGVINMSIMHDKSINELSAEFLNIQKNEILYNNDFFENNNFYGEKINKNDKNTIIEILNAMANLENSENTVKILTKKENNEKTIYDFFIKNKKGMIEKDAFYLMDSNKIEEIIKMDKIKCIVSMPFNNILKNQVIIFNDDKTNRNNILFIQAQNFFEKGSDKIKPENYKELVEVFRSKKEINGISRLISNEAVLKKGCNLDILGYVFKTKEYVDLDELKAEKDNIFNLMIQNRENCDNLIKKYLEEK
ncbi:MULTISPECIES: hypothetical protein [unclassified Leptotrichia]|uniref:hypothetical protein n=1 Tax=unclassified Leptotrichia TaxID=2633022 RepID=UPI0003AE3205|nr:MULTISPECIES: hypothetical protein [unclassified Leptotrichia]ERL27311.1 hypothetical protein HMPREF9108_00054 [Leptotrichia sp. oral taxon 225 str. F0581]WLD73587.1 hypothetical protein QU666_08060 [Leptotrichia sp. HMT-225]